MSRENNHSPELTSISGLTVQAMTKEYLSRLLELEGMGDQLLRSGLRGVEKESLRVTSQGRLSKAAHPYLLGSPLTHPHITTDFSEAQLEFVTAPYSQTWEVMQFLTELHQFTIDAMDKNTRSDSNELIWPSSMPCHVMNDEIVPVAEFGKSNVGLMKHVYRLGLGERYGRLMQTISGVHFNFSIPEKFWPVYKEIHCDVSRRKEGFISSQYFHMLRNLRRAGWLLLYLFGCSPAFSSSFNVKADGFKQHKHSYYLPYATTLRMSDIGYKNKSQDSIRVSSNSVDEYIRDLSNAMHTSYAPYENIGVKVSGAYKQLNAKLLQIENEYYSSVRPKRTARSGERPTCALHRAGVEYLEVRSLDLNMFEPVGVSEEQLQFMELLLWYCLLYPSPELTADDEKVNSHNQLLVARAGRDPNLKLRHFDKERPLSEWAMAIMHDMEPLAELMDKNSQNPEQRIFTNALAAQKAKIIDSEQTPSALVLHEMDRANVSFHELAHGFAERHTAYFRALRLNQRRADFFTTMAEKSHQKQKEIEAADNLSFDDYLENYFSKGFGSNPGC